MMFFALRWFHVWIAIVSTDARGTNKAFFFGSYDEYANWCTPNCCPEGDCYTPCADYGICKEGIVLMLLSESTFTRARR